MTIRRQLLASFAGIIATVLAFNIATIIVFVSFQEIADDVISSDMPVFITLGQIKSDGIGLIEAARGSLAAAEAERDEELAEYRERRTDLIRKLGEFNDLRGEVDTDISAVIASLDGVSLTLISATDAYISNVRQGVASAETLEPLNQTIETSEERFLTAVDQQIDEINRDVAFELNELDESVQWLLALLSGGSVLLLGGALGVGFWLSNRLVNPIVDLSDALEHFRRGEEFERIKVRRQDEVGTLATAFNTLADDLQATTVSRDYVDNIVQAMGSALIVTDGNGTIRTTNAALQLLLGYNASDLEGQSIDHLLPQEPIDMTVGSTQTTLKRKDGTTVTVALSQRMVGPDELAVYNAQDLTELQQAQQQLFAAQDEIETQGKRVKRLYTMIDLMLKQLNSVFQHGASREELQMYMATLNTEFEALHGVIATEQQDTTPEA